MSKSFTHGVPRLFIYGAIAVSFPAISQIIPEFPSAQRPTAEMPLASSA